MTMRRRALLVLLGCGVAAEASLAASPARAQGMAPTIDAPSAKGLVEAGGLLVDVRTPRELRENGRPAGSVHVPLQGDDLTFNPDFVKQLLDAAGGDKNRPLALICSGNRRSAHAARLLAGQGFAQVFSVGEGIFGSNLGPGWAARGLPMAP
jgi:rhodanese-related sulfurtransferase